MAEEKDLGSNPLRKQSAFAAGPSPAPSARVLGRAWWWRRKLDTGEAATIQDIDKAEKVSTQFVGPIMRLAYLSPDVLERLLLWREAQSVTLTQMTEARYVIATAQ